MTNTFNYLKSYSFMNETSYPYVAYSGSCRYNAAAGHFNVLSYSTIPSGAALTMQAQVAV